MTISELGDYILIVGSLVVAITNIYKFIAKPTWYFKRKIDEKEKNKINEAMSSILPEILEEHDLQTREKYKNDRQAYLLDIKRAVLEDLSSSIQEIKDTNLKQNQSIEILNANFRDVLREKIMRIYHKNKKTRNLIRYEKEALDQYYKDYKRISGNSYIDKYYGRMELWNIIEDPDE